MSSQRNTKIEIIIEKNDEILWGRVENKGNFMPTPYGKTQEQVIENLKELILDYQAHEGKDDPLWKNVDVKKLEVTFLYDLTSLFSDMNYLNLSAIADRMKINRSLMAQYASGLKYPSIERVKQIEEVIHAFGKEMKAVRISAVKRNPQLGGGGAADKKSAHKRNTAKA